MDTQPFFSNFDLAQLCLYLFWAFFVGLVIYLQKENNREGFPLETEAGDLSNSQGPYAANTPKTFKLPHGRGEVSVPNGVGESRTLKMEQRNVANGSGRARDSWPHGNL